MRSLLVPAALVAALVSFPSAPAHAAASCHGLPATIEASDGQVVGTPGPDVIVATGSVTDVDSGTGDDTVCVVAASAPVTVVTRAGDDTVDASAAGVPIAAYVGFGADTYLGGDQSDVVSTMGEDGPDTLTTGAGRDSVSTSGPVVLDLGADDDEALLSGVGQGSTVDLGTGRDRVAAAGRRAARVDLAEGRVTIDGSTARLLGAEDVLVIARRGEVVGDAGPNRIRAATCQEELSGRGGDDDLRDLSDSIRVPGRCLHHQARMSGGSGDDLLRGSRGDDVLLGGAGRDTAYGARGSDHCVAEEQLTCER
jgi:Ca2+-binding RTX toxin-like protein